MHADHIMNRATLKSFGMKYRCPSSMLVSIPTHTAKNKSDFTRSANINSVTDYIITNGERPFEFITSLPEKISIQNGASS